MTVATPPARPRRQVLLVGGLVAVIVAIGGGLLLTQNLFNGPTASARPASTLGPAAGLVVTPGGLLLPAIGATKQLAATSPDGSEPAGSITWTSSRPDVATVDAAGLVTATSFGSAQVTAAAGDQHSGPVLVTVVAPAPGTVLVDDSQVVGTPVETDPSAEVTATSTYDVVLRGATVKVGDLLLGTGEIPVGGRVVAIAPSGTDTKVTLGRVKLPEILPDLDLDEDIDLSLAPVEIPADVAANYDVVREGNTFRFTPKPEFDAQVKAGAATPGSVLGRLPRGHVASIGNPLLAAATGTQALPPFTECEKEGPFSGLPIKLSEAPTFEIEAKPALDVLWTDAEKHILVRADPKITAKIGVKSTVSFSGKFGCEIELWRFRVPAGWLALLVTGLIPFGVGFELGGEVQVAEFGITQTTEATGTGFFGIDCPLGKSCTLTGDGSGSIGEPKVETDIQSLQDFRVKPSLEIFGFMKFEVGNPFIKRWQLEAAEMKLGAKLEADWAPRVVQIKDTGYQSKYEFKVGLEAKAGPDLEGVAADLGLGDILSVGVEKEWDVGASPTGSLKLDKDAYNANDKGTARIHFESAGLHIGPVYMVDRVLLVSYVDGKEAVLATISATTDQVDFEASFTASGPLTKDQLFAFVVPRFTGLALELAAVSASTAGRIVFYRRDPALGVRLFSVNPDGTDEKEIKPSIGKDRLFSSRVTSSPDGKQIAFTAGAHIYVANADGTNARVVADGRDAAWSPDGTSLLYVTGLDNVTSTIATVNPSSGAVRKLIEGQGFDLFPAWSPDGSHLVFVRKTNISDPSSRTSELWTAKADGTELRRIWQPSAVIEEVYLPAWSPDGSRLLVSHNDTSTFTQTWTMKPDGTDIRVVSSGEGGDWSPDGMKIVVLFLDAGLQGGDLSIVNADGSGETKMAFQAKAVGIPSWIR